MRSIEEILKDSKTIAVVGLSPKPERASGHVAEYLQQQGYRVLPVNPNYAGQQILGEPVMRVSRLHLNPPIASIGKRVLLLCISLSQSRGHFCATCIGH